MIGIVDYKMGNLGSIANMLKKIGAVAVVSSDPHELGRAEKLILPGVGAFDTGMRNIEALGLRGILEESVVGRRVPVLGICLGMQLLGRSSEEGSLPGLGWIDAKSCRFRFEGGNAPLKVPHMGWNATRPSRPTPLFTGLEEGARFYFVHSFYVACTNAVDVAATAAYGFEFAAAVQREHIQGVQFHPEKSHRYGMTLLRNFVGT